MENIFKVREQNDFASVENTKMFELLGRGQKSCAYTHSVEAEHHVFINLHSLQFYCLPDNYEIIDSSLDDIKVRECHSK